MASEIIQPARIQDLNTTPVADPAASTHVLYWMQQSQRAEDNHALEHAVRRANELELPLVVGFGLMDGYPEANLRHYHFLVEGLQDVAAGLARRGIAFLVRHGAPDAVALDLARGAALVVCDRGYLRHQKRWRRRVGAEAPCRVEQVETDVVVPVEVTSEKREYAARTLRPRLHRHLDDYLVELRTTALDHPSLAHGTPTVDLPDPGHPSLDVGSGPEAVPQLLDRLDLDRSVPPVPLFRGGTREAKRTLLDFLDDHLPRYDEQRNQPQADAVSHMSKYLHFGQISPLWIALEIQACHDAPEAERDSYLEELLVRRELAMNFVHYAEDDYDAYDTLPEWARKTLAEHAGDEREHLYDDEELEAARTHDPYWNAAMREMVHTGYMHNYMRMYWGKKILEWSPDPRTAFEVALALNNRYFLDGRDANSFAGVAWCFGLHDRAWAERDVYGKVRYMSASGLERKARPDAYVEKVERLVQKVEEAGDG